jgi:hypothetical protein
MSEQESPGRVNDDELPSESDVHFSNNGEAVINGQIGVVNGDANFYLGDCPVPSSEQPAIVMIVRAFGSSRVNQAGRDQTVIGP